MMVRIVEKEKKNKNVCNRMESYAYNIMPFALNSGLQYILGLFK